MKLITIKVSMILGMLTVSIFFISVGARPVDRTAGLEGFAAWYLRLHTNATQVMSPEVETAFYAGIKHIFFPNGFIGELSRFGTCEPDYVIRYAKRWNTSHIMIDGKITDDLNCPELKPLLNEDYVHDDLKFIKSLSIRGRNATIWEVV